MVVRLAAWVCALACGGCGVSQPPPRLDQVAPSRVCDGAQATLVLAGADFAPLVESALQTPRLAAPAVRFVAAGLTVPADQVRWRSAARLEVDATLGPADWDVVVENPDGMRGALVAGLRVLASPRLDAVDPDNVCRSGGTLTLHGDRFQPGAQALLVDGATRLGAVTVTVDSPMQVTAVFGANTFNAGGLVDLTVENPDGCVATLAGSVRVRTNGAGCP